MAARKTLKSTKPGVSKKVILQGDEPIKVRPGGGGGLSTPPKIVLTLANASDWTVKFQSNTIVITHEKPIATDRNIIDLQLNQSLSHARLHKFAPPSSSTGDTQHPPKPNELWVIGLRLS